MVRNILSLFLMVTSFSIISAQNFLEVATNHILNTSEELGLTAKDVSDLVLMSQHQSRLSGNTHTYFRQAVNGIQIHQGDINISLNNAHEPISYFNSAISGAHALINISTPVLSPEEAIQTTILAFEFPIPQELIVVQSPVGKDLSARYEADGYDEPIPIRLVYFQNELGALRLCWDLSILSPEQSNWWNIRIDAKDGTILDQLDWIAHCQFDTDHGHDTGNYKDLHPSPFLASPMAIEAANSYNVYAEPIESPSHGSRSIKTSPWDLTASPYGWHDTDGAAGAEYTITRGNNVHAQEDANGNNGTGTSPNGGATLDFDFTLNSNQAPSGYQDVAIINLFYWNNYIHDVMYHNGFDEAAGNFQSNNYGNGASGNDYVLADAQDGSGLNNANFGTPPDGSSPRMQMFLWSAAFSPDLTINSPAGISGSYDCVEAGFGPAPPSTAIVADLVLVDDGAAAPSEGCNTLINSAALTGKIALIDRGNCAFVTKVQNAQNAGAVACVVCNNVSGSPITMGGTTGSITIPSVMISQSDCALLKAQLGTGVNVSFSGIGSAFQIDGDFDNGIIAHEYGHGISNRLTGGRTNTGCLGNAEQMGEGWSDFFALILTMDATDFASQSRGIGTFAVGEGTSGPGIRPAPYTTDIGVNSFTYSDITNTGAISQPHGIGFLWASMLWELTWNLIATDGFDPDLINGTGGNNIALQLVNEGMMMQPCNPGFVDGRDAILNADTALFGGSHGCQIWEAFSKRGLGLSASQGSSFSRSDGSEAYDMPVNACNVAFPVEWLDFTAAPNEQAIILSWLVEQQPDNVGFVLERKTSDMDKFEEFARIPVALDAIGVQAYQFEDQFVFPGTRYFYRLRQLDVDGSFNYSDIVEAQLKVNGSLIAKLYPNPSNGHITLEFSQLPEGILHAVVTNNLGQKAFETSILNANSTLDVDLSDLASGMYILRILHNGKQHIQQFTIE